MKTANELVSELKSMGVHFRIENGEMRATAEKGLLTAELLATLREHKPEIMGRVIDGLTPSELTGIDLEYYDDLFDLMIGPSHKMDLIKAESKAMQLVRESMKKLYTKEKSE